MLQLPLLFMTAFFVINIEEFPKDSSGATTLPLRYVCKYICKSYYFLLACLGIHDARSWNLGRCICTLHRSSLLRTCSPPMDQSLAREDAIPFIGLKQLTHRLPDKQTEHYKILQHLRRGIKNGTDLESSQLAGQEPDYGVAA
jgi:hypothetical protein